MMRFAGYIEIYIPTYLYVMIFTVGLITYFVVNWLLNKQIQRIDTENHHYIKTIYGIGYMWTFPS